MIARFSLYDFIAVVMPGVFFLWALSAFLGVPVASGLGPVSGDLAETSVLIVVGYVVGLLLQGLSQRFTEAALLRSWGGFPSARWLLPGDTRFTPAYRKELAEALLSRFAITLREESVEATGRSDAMKRNQEIFYRCYRSVEATSALPETFNAQYGLFRILLTTFFLLGASAAARMAYAFFLGHSLDLRFGSLLSLCVVGALISYWRVAKRAEDFAKSVYDLFLAQSAKAATGTGS
jgi:hypothetical protein